jgi:nitroimidazol reductase NimA-like FMN-containing flavoprotein (pyridoxamine 5'-phosphate oxidase superfamily)
VRYVSGDFLTKPPAVQREIPYFGGTIIHMQTPTFRELSKDECLDVLRRNTYGRIAFTLEGRVDVEPINYVLEGEWLYLRTTTGTKVTMLRHDPWVAFEVDEVRAPLDWTSVVVKGTVYFISGIPGADDPREYQKAVAVLRRLTPDAMTPEDPTPSRSIILRISLNELHGRAAPP